MAFLGALGIIDIPGLYLRAPYFWDSMIYLLIFMGLASYVFQNSKYMGRKGKPVAIGVGLALTISLVVWEYQHAWNLGRAEFATLPLFLIAILLYFLFYRVFHDLFGVEKATCAMSLAYLVVYTGMSGTFATPMASAMAVSSLIETAFIILTITSIIVLVICFLGLFGKKEGHEDPEDPEHPHPKLTVKIIQPPPANRRFPAGTDIPIQAQISGGNGHHAWQVFLDGTRHVAGTTDANVSHTFHGLVAGTYVVRVEATTSDETDHDDITIVVGATGSGDISGKAINITATPHTPVHGAVIQLRQGSTTGTLIQQTTSTAAGDFRFTGIPIAGTDLYLVGTHATLGTGVHMVPPPPIRLSAGSHSVTGAEVHFGGGTPPPGSFSLDILSPLSSAACFPSGTTDIPLRVQFTNGTPNYDVTSIEITGPRNIPNYGAFGGITTNVWNHMLHDAASWPDGTYTLLVKAKDSTGATAQDTETFCVGAGGFTVTITTPDPSIPATTCYPTTAQPLKLEGHVTHGTGPYTAQAVLGKKDASGTYARIHHWPLLIGTTPPHQFTPTDILDAAGNHLVDGEYVIFVSVADSSTPQLHAQNQVEFCIGSGTPPPPTPITVEIDPIAIHTGSNRFTDNGLLVVRYADRVTNATPLPYQYWVNGGASAQARLELLVRHRPAVGATWTYVPSGMLLSLITFVLRTKGGTESSLTPYATAHGAGVDLVQINKKANALTLHVFLGASHVPDSMFATLGLPAGAEIDVILNVILTDTANNPVQNPASGAYVAAYASHRLVAN